MGWPICCGATLSPLLREWEGDPDFPDPVSIIGSTLHRVRAVLADPPEPVPAREFPSVAALLPEIDSAIEALDYLRPAADTGGDKT